MAKDTVPNVDDSIYTATDNDRKPMESVALKRQVTIKSRVTEQFREKAKSELSEELKLVDSQLEQLENQYQAMLQQIENLAKSGQNVGKQLEQLNRDAQERRAQLANVKMQVASNLANLDRVQNGDTVVTGVLENFVDVHVGDNLYKKLRGAEIILQDGIITSIVG